MPIPAKRSSPRTPVTLQIEDVAFGGAGVGRIEGKAVFVPYTIMGETVTVQITERKKSYNRGRLAEILTASRARISPPCPYFGKCGGCDYQHIAYEEQLAIKNRQMVEILKRIGRLQNIEVLPTVASPASYGFRNRITVHSDGDRIGFFEKETRKVLDIDRCAIAAPQVNEKLRQIRTRWIGAGEHRTLREEEGVSTFTQTNNSVAKLLLDYVANHAEGAVLLDGYCGSGFFSHALSARFRTVVGIDWSERAIETARREAKPNEIYLLGEVGELIDEALAHHQPDCVILDPSAEGIDNQTAAALNRFAPPKVLYVSCNPSTLARDLGLLAERFEMGVVQPFDMFPQTAAIEAVAILKGR